MTSCAAKRAMTCSTAAAEPATISAAASGDDILYGSEDGGDVMSGDAGRDRLYGRGGNEHLRGGDRRGHPRRRHRGRPAGGWRGRRRAAGRRGRRPALRPPRGSGTGDDNAVDWLYGDFGTDGNEVGSGGDQLFGQGGNDVLFGEGGDDAITAGGGASNIVNFGAGEGADPTAFNAPIVTAAPTVFVTTTDPRSGPTLPSEANYEAWWGEFAGSASGGGVSASPAAATEASLAIGPAARYVAWADARNGNFEIYVAQYAGGAWSALGGSADGGGVVPSTGGSRRPSIAYDTTTGSPIVAWTEIAPNGTSNIRVVRWNGATLAWEALGTSIVAGGISGTGTADSARLVMTAQGPVVAWLDTSSGTAQVYAKRFVLGNWVDLAAGSSAGGGVSGAAGGVSRPHGRDRRQQGGDRLRRQRRHRGARGRGRRLHAERHGARHSGASATPTLAYHQGTLYAAWADDTAGRAQVYVMNNAGGGWTAAGTGAATGGGVSGTLGRSVAPRLAANGGELWLVWGNDESVASERRQSGRAVRQALEWQRLRRAPRGRRVGLRRGLLRRPHPGLRACGRRCRCARSSRGPNSPARDRRSTCAATRMNGANVFTASNTAQLQDLLDTTDFGANDVILLATGQLRRDHDRRRRRRREDHRRRRQAAPRSPARSPSPRPT